MAGAAMWSALSALGCSPVHTFATVGAPALPRPLPTQGDVGRQRSHHQAVGAGSQEQPRGVAPTPLAVVPLALGGCAALARRRSRRHHARVSLAAYTSAPQTYEGAPIGPPPDLPSLLLKNRIVYLGTPITDEVTELIIAQLLYLNYESADKPVTMYINSTGSTVKNNTQYMGESKVGRETDAFAIADCMQYIKPQVQTIAIGQAYGTAAVLLGLGTKGKRFALPNATIMLSEPREPPARGPRQASDIRILAKEVLQNRATMTDLLAKATGKGRDDVVKDTNRCYYMSPSEAVEYNLIDKVLTPEKLKESGQELPSFVSAM
mmetsp:Transcript_81118/g.181494  ORF Transcript_81118/g.181494 Transcript_81118/m.181494 type:complete len:321 (-) Transcript_81118:57-1019(-)